MPVDTTATLRIDKPATQVAAYLREPDNDPRWIGGIQSARLLAPRPVGVGSQVERVATFLGRRIEYVNEITETGDDVSRLIYGDAKYERLAGLKRVWDPDNVFRANHNVAPAA